MNKSILSFVVLLFTLFTLQAQEFNTIPFHTDLSTLQDGWYKFELENTYFDVELAAGKLKKGIIKWADGSKYSGSLSGTSFSGKGTYTWPDGSRYEGAFRKHKRHGKGSYINFDGTKWSGKWAANHKNGKGTVFDANGKALKHGVWQSNELIKESLLE
ncbi:hypothetical protein [Flagellimonas onchidii]|uniref:hypothetical protein n=1 Tax=Flagellimonas onchidii TaxID=2562684 RepID=UPI0010A6AEED|nr:hypothetical protein [Allomuricauda onchidii]